MLATEFTDAYGTFALDWGSIHHVEVVDNHATCYREDESVLSEISFVLHEDKYVKHGEYKYYPQTRTVIKHYKYDLLHREDGPAIIISYQDDVYYEYWYKDGKVHHIGFPAIVCFKNGVLKSETWKQEGKIHRDDGPAFIMWYSNGNLKEVKYFKNEKLHREDGPASLILKENGELYHEVWYKEGDYHREDGPAVIMSHGVAKQDWYHHGVKIDMPADEPNDVEIDVPEDESNDVEMLEAPGRWEDILLEKEQQNNSDPEWD